MATRKSAKAHIGKFAQLQPVLAVAAKKVGQKTLVTKRTILLRPEDFTQDALHKFHQLASQQKVTVAVEATSPLKRKRLHLAHQNPWSRELQASFREASDLLAVLDLHVSSNTVTSSQAKDQWPMIAREAEQGVLTPIERRGGATLVVVPAEKLVQMAAHVPSEMTFGDLLRNHPGVKADAVPRPRSSGGPVTRLRLPAGKPSVNS